jgi:Protein of unknown function (DUF559)/Transcriptional regulator, AbiEi antitoxin
MFSEVDRRIAEEAGRQHGVFTLAQVQHAGGTRSGIRHRLSSGQWVRVAPGVFRLPGVAFSWQARLFAAVAGADSGRVASHRAAGQLYGIPGFTKNWVELTVPRGTRAPARPIRFHWSRVLPPHHVKRPSGIPATSIARTLADLAGALHPKQTERALDNCLAADLVTVAAMWRVHHDLAPSGRAGLGLIRELLEARGDGYVAPASELERRLLDLVIAAGLPVPEREIDLGDSDGWIGRVEFVYQEAKLLIEVDGRLHHTALLDRKHDRDRDNALMASGWRVLRIDYDMLVHRPDEVVGLIRRALG